MGRVIGIDMSGIGFRAAVLRDGRVEMIPGSDSAPTSAARMLAGWKRDAESFLGGPVDGAAIAVSAMLTEVQRDRIRRAAGEAGLEKVRLISAPAAAALYYDWKHGHPTGKFLAVHMGATAIDAAALELGDSVAEVLAVDGTDRWGAAGSDGVTPEMTTELQEMIRGVLDSAGISQTDLAGFIPSGDGDCVFALMDTLRAAAGCYPVSGTEPEESAVRGAAVRAAILNGDPEDLLLLEVTPYPLGFVTLGNVCTRYIERNTTIPTRKSDTFSNASDGQSNMHVRVFQGESDKLEENTVIGSYTVSGFTPGPRGKAQVEVTLDVDADGRVTIYAREPDGREGRPLTVIKEGGQRPVPPPKPPEKTAPAPPKETPRPKAAPAQTKKAPKPKAAPAPPKETPKPAGDGRLEAVLKLLPVYDSLSRAVQYETDEAKRQGSEAILRQYRTILSDMGVTVIETVGSAFDPHLHDAQGHITDPRYGPGEIVLELEAGFMMDGKVIRFAKVQVAN